MASVDNAAGQSESPAQATRRFLESLFNDTATSGTSVALPPALSDDVIWTATNSSPLAGRWVGKQTYLTKLLGVLSSKMDTTAKARMTIHRIKVDAEGEWATVHFRTEGARGKNGAGFGMEYAWLMRVGPQVNGSDRGRIKEVVGFYDGVKMYKLFDEKP